MTTLPVGSQWLLITYGCAYLFVYYCVLLSLGTDMLSHLLVCERKTAYSSEEEARANIANSEDSLAPKPAQEPTVETVSNANNSTTFTLLCIFNTLLLDWSVAIMYETERT